MTDRVGMLHTLSTLPQHPESVPINALVRVQGDAPGQPAQSGYLGYGPDDRYGPGS